MVRAASMCIALSLLAGSGAGAGPIDFVDHGLSGRITFGRVLGGVSVIDADGDGWMDLILANGPNRPILLFRNVEDPADPPSRTFVDVTPGSGLDDAEAVARNGSRALVADYDNDGDPDVFLLGYRADGSSGMLYRNDGGAFTNVSIASGVRISGDTPDSASWSDFDLDGDVDLLIVNQIDSALPVRLWRNNGDGTFSDASNLLPAITPGNGAYAHTWTDFDADGDPDAFILMRGGDGAIVLENLGGAAFAETADAVGFGQLGPAPMGVSAGDYDGDGDLDLAVTNGEIGSYYQNTGGAFTKVALAASIFGWGVSWLDADNDADLDMFQAGSFPREPAHNKLFRNDGGVFTDISAALNDESVASQCSVAVDYDNDGRMDLVIVHPDDYVSVARNVTPDPGAWIELKLSGDGARVNRDAIGALVRITAGGVTQVRELAGGSSASETEDPRLHFGLGEAAQVDQIEIVWPHAGDVAARTQVLAGPFAPNQLLEIAYTCPADVNADGLVNSQDFIAFLNAFTSGDPSADFNRDGVVDSQDFIAFLNAFVAGC